MSIINRHNYESFFLMYTDNELSVTERKAVEEFVDANPDLLEELVMLQQSVLKPDNIVFEDKKSLLKDEFNPSILQEKLLLYLDNELTAAERKEIEGSINTGAGIKKELDILRQTKLLPGSAIVFKDKRSLYRKETGRVVTFPWWRIAAAAAFIGFALWGGSVFLNNSDKTTAKENGTGVTPEKVAKSLKVEPPHDTDRQNIEQPISPVAQSVANENEVVSKHFDTKTPSTTIIKASPQKAALRRLTNSDIETVIDTDIVSEKTNNLPKPYFDHLNKIDSNKTIPAYVISNRQVPVKKDIVNKKDEYQADSYASIASFTDNTEDNNDRVLFMDEEKIKKTRLGGIFRKVTRVLGRSANIKPGENNIKVANLEFAIQ